MHKITLSLGIWLASVGLAYADNRIFPTDILNQWEVDAGASASYQTLSTDFRISNSSATETRKITTENVGVRLGLGAGWQIGASLHYVSRDAIHTKWKSSGNSYDYKNSYSQNPQFWAAYGIVNDKDNPFSLVGEFMVSPKTTDFAHSYGAKLSAGWESSETLKLYSIYSISRNNDTNTTNRIEIGAYKDISDGVTLIPSVEYSAFRATNYFHSAGQYGISLSANVQLAKNTYLIPTIVNYGNTPVKTKDDFFHADSMHNGMLISLGIYHLF